MSGFAVIVEFRLKPGTRPAFRRLIDANARASVGLEAACRRFDVLEPESQADSILLYEIYDDRAAFQTHLVSEHYRSFAAASADLCAGKTVTTCDLVCEGGA
jgi:autoinducer 2-degrading protein